MNENISVMAVVPVRGMVIFPGITLSFDAVRDKNIRVLEKSMNDGTMVLLAAQKNSAATKPLEKDIYKTGTIAVIKQIINMPGNLVRVVADGEQRGIVREMIEDKPYYQAVVEALPEIYPDKQSENSAYIRILKKHFEEYFAETTHITPENFLKVMGLENIAELTDVIASCVDFEIPIKQSLLEECDILTRSEKLLVKLRERTMSARVEKEVMKKVKKRIDENQRDYYLREQLKVIHNELGDGEDVDSEAEEYKNKINELEASEEVKEKLRKDVGRFSRMPASTAESSVLRTYLDTVLDLPWNVKTDESFDIEKTRRILDDDHYGLEKIKERIQEYLVVRKLTEGKNGTILCLVGPPGVGKTSVAKSVAKALGRKYVRVSLGGIHDESDIRGHRKTYIGAMEGRIISAVAEAKTKNPLILLDEIDKMGADYKGDPSAALLEVLDYEQNYAFRDHYIEVPFDLSQVLFITTANTLDTISAPLRDRMEIIELSGYTREEKFNIAKRHLVKKAAQKNGLTLSSFKVNDAAIYELVDYYTREAGVRKLEQQLEELARKAAKNMLENDKKSVTITKKFIADNLGKRKYHFELMNKKSEIGVVRGLAWTSVGGDTLSVEVNVMDGSGKVELTGKLGEVMQESAKTAISYIRSQSNKLGIENDFYKTKDIHIHVPEGAVPKDGPSAGITMATALVSALSNKPVRNDVAMTGEITLRGRVLPIGGLKEKSLAAYRAGIKTIIIPQDNKEDIEDIPQEVRENINFIPTSSMDVVLKNAIL